MEEEKYLTAIEINDRVEALAANPRFKDKNIVSVFDLTHKTIPGNLSVKCLKIGKPKIPKPTPVLIIGGMHAREWAPPDSLIDFAERLLDAAERGVAYLNPGFVMLDPERDEENDPGPLERIVFNDTEPDLFPAWLVKQVIGTLELYIVPLVNPDGRQFSQEPGFIEGIFEDSKKERLVEKKRWRKNRRNLGNCSDGSAAIGVDPNRNFQLPEWDFTKYYDQGVLTDPIKRGYINMTNEMDSSETYNPFFNKFGGITAGSEMETINIMELITQKKIKFFLDVHAFDRAVYAPWSVNKNQIVDPFLTQFNERWDNVPVNTSGTKGRPLNDITSATLEAYQEYFPTLPGFPFQLLLDNLSKTMAELIFKAAGPDEHAKKRSNYASKSILTLYSSPGGSVDYAFSKQLDIAPGPDPVKGNKVQENALFPVFALAIEAGHESDGGFWPLQNEKNQFRKVRREIQFGVLGMLKYAASFSQPPEPLPPPNPQPSSSKKGCLPVLIFMISLLSATAYLIILLFL